MSVVRLSIIVPVPRRDRRPAVLDSLGEGVGLGLVEVLVPVGRCPSHQRNQAAKQATSEILYFLDDDSRVSASELQRMLKTFEELQAAALGGPAVTHQGASFFERCVGEVMATPFGSQAVRARAVPVGKLRRVEGEELVTCNLLIRRHAFFQVDGFDEGIYPSEDVDLMRRLSVLGAVLYYDPKAKVERTRRRTPWQFARQFAAYGQGRGLRFFRHFRLADLGFLLPTLLLLNIVLWPWVPDLGLRLYGFGVIGAGLWSAIQCRSPLVGLVALGLLPLHHLAYGFGMLMGLFGRKPRLEGEVEVVERYELRL